MSEDDVAQIAARVREAREFVGLSQGQVAEALGIPRASVSELETGKRKITAVELKRFGELFRRPPSYFLGESEHELLAENETMKALFRTSRDLNEADAEQLLKFAEFLKNAGKREPRGKRS